MSLDPDNPFITDELFNYINTLHNERNKQKEVITTKLRRDVFESLSEFLTLIAKYDPLETRATIKQVLLNIVRNEHDPEKLLVKINNVFEKLSEEEKETGYEVLSKITSIIDLKGKIEEKDLKLIIDFNYDIPRVPASDFCNKLDKSKPNNSLFLALFTCTDVININKLKGEPILLELLKGTNVLVYEDTSPSAPPEPIGEQLDEDLRSMEGGAIDGFLIKDLSKYAKLILSNQEEEGVVVEKTYESSEIPTPDIGYEIDSSKSVYGNCEMDTSSSKKDRLKCLKTTTLQTRPVPNKNMKNPWRVMKKEMSVPNHYITPNVLKSLSYSFKGGSNYHTGGDPVDDYLKETNIDVDTCTVFTIRRIMERALRVLKKNDISLKEDVVQEIKNNIGLLKKAEETLSELAEKIILAGKISSLGQKPKNKEMDNEELQKYVDDYKKITYSSNKTAVKLNENYLYFMGLMNEDGKELIEGLREIGKTVKK